MVKLSFTKMHGLGNDYIYFNCLETSIEDPNTLAKKLSDRHFGVGGDGIILILPSDNADFKMRMFNADGSEAEMCGNAIRCVAKYVYDKKVTDKDSLNIETGNGLLSLKLNVVNGTVDSVRVDMGEPTLAGLEIPTTLDKEKIVNEDLVVGDETFKMTCVSVGNPHCIIFCDDSPTDELVHGIGPIIEVHPLFPNRVNVEFVKVVSRHELEMRVWERGTGETMACGTGAAAVCVAAALNDLSERKVKIHLLGGDLDLAWAEDNHIYKTGPAQFVFEGEVDV